MASRSSGEIMRVQFILKKNEAYGCGNYFRRSSGLWNSVSFVAETLRCNGIITDVTEVTDNNDIDREVTRFRPDICIIEALWVVPEKFDILMRLHPCVKWFCHIHSNIPFLACEGVAIEWLQGYHIRGVGIITNSKEAQEAVSTAVGGGRVFFCPNTYTRRNQTPKGKHQGRTLNIGCFGAIRPMKNHLIQAIAALQFAREQGKYLRFHVNGWRIESGTECLRNLQALFSQGDAELVLHPWLEPADFRHFLHRRIDLGMQVSLSETFNVVTADYVAAGLPVVVSPEISWVTRWNQAPCDSASAIAETMGRVWGNRALTCWNQRLLRKYSGDAAKRWISFLSNIHSKVS